MKSLHEWWHELFDDSKYDDNDWDSWPWPGKLVLYVLIGIFWVVEMIDKLRSRIGRAWFRWILSSDRSPKPSPGR